MGDGELHLQNGVQRKFLCLFLKVYIWQKRGVVASPTHPAYSTHIDMDRDGKGKHVFLYPSRRVVQFVCDAQK